MGDFGMEERDALTLRARFKSFEYHLHSNKDAVLEDEKAIWQTNGTCKRVVRPPLYPDFLAARG